MTLESVRGYVWHQAKNAFYAGSGAAAATLGFVSMKCAIDQFCLLQKLQPSQIGDVPAKFGDIIVGTALTVVYAKIAKDLFRKIQW